MSQSELSLGHDCILNSSARAFNALDEHLNDPASSLVLEIEILPSALCPPGESVIIRDGNCVGVPKKLLALAYDHALRTVFGSLRTASGDLQATATALRATSIILLLSPEHLTASNLRKRYLLSKSNIAIPVDLAAEFRMLDSFLTSPLPRHTKSPTLWSHRRWLLTKFPPSIIPLPSKVSKVSIVAISIERVDGPVLEALLYLLSEIDIILRAATQHPRNYYAFRHLRLLLQEILPLHFFSTSTSQSEQQKYLATLALHVIPIMQNFCWGHHSDTSAWSALIFLLQCAGDVNIASKVIVDTVAMVEKWSLKGEAVWMFLRTIGAGGLKGVEVVAKAVKEWLGSVAGSGVYVGDSQIDVAKAIDDGEMPKTALAELATQTLDWIGRHGLQNSI